VILRSRRLWGALAALGVTALVLVPLLTGLREGSGEPVRSALVGRAAPPLAGPTLDGRSFDLAQFGGQPVLVNVWASWCGPCRDELPLLARTQERLGTAGLRVATIDTRDGPVAAQALLAEVGATGLTTVLDPDGRLAVSWGAHGVPETFLLDRSGTIQAFQPGPITEEWVRRYVEPLVTATP
jgi:cytochrome c biogenesis protein CcmG, thiol:disulfide interchange protein DsbE